MNGKRPQANGPGPRQPRRPTTKAWSGLLAGILAIAALVVPALTKSSTASPGPSASRSSAASRSATTIDYSSNGNSNSSSKSSKSSKRRSSTTTTTIDEVSSNRTDPRLRKIGFRSQQRLDDHYRKHGREFGNITKAEYLAMAQDLRDSPLSKRVIETTQRDGTISRFDRYTGAFTAFNRDLTIRTFFKPNDGEDYFWRASKTDR